VTGPATLEHLRRYVVAGLRRIERGFDSPEDDWTMVCFVQTPAGVEVLALANDLFRDGMSKDALAAFLRGCVITRRAYRYALLLNVHMARSPSEEELEAVHEERMRIEELERATEHLFMLLGDAEQEQAWMAPIERRPGMLLRRCGRWERLDTREGWTFEGRFAGLNEAMR
jgi:hypothetical protein